MNRPPNKKKSSGQPIDFWKETLMMAMHSLNIKEVVIRPEVIMSLSNSCPPGEIAYLITRKNNKDPNDIGFTLHLAYGSAERDAILSQKIVL